MRIASRIAGVALVAVASTAGAQEAARLSKDAVETLVVGKELKYARTSDGNVVAWDVRKDGSIWFAPKNTQRAVTIGGEYKVEDDGSFCVKWRDDKYVKMTDACYFFVAEGGKTSMTGKRNPDRVIGTLVE